MIRACAEARNLARAEHLLSVMLKAGGQADAITTSQRSRYVLKNAFGQSGTSTVRDVEGWC